MQAARSRAIRVLLAAACVLLAAGCVLSAVGCISVTPRAETAFLRVLAEPEDVVVYVNDLFVGSARVLAVRPEPLRPGVKYVTFQAPGYFPHDLRLDLHPGTTTVRVSLRPIPP